MKSSLAAPTLATKPHSEAGNGAAEKYDYLSLGCVDGPCLQTRIEIPWLAKW
jgi:hypothetical protein